MERLPANFTEELFGCEMLPRLNRANCEEEVEDSYKHFYSKVSKCNIVTIKVKVPGGRCKTDGVLELNYNDKYGYAIMETKFNKSLTDWEIKKALIQILMYDWKFEQVKKIYDFQVYIICDESHFIYIDRKDLESVKEVLWYIFPKITETPSKAFSNLLVKTAIKDLYIPFKVDKITSTYSFHNVVRDIYKRTIK